MVKQFHFLSRTSYYIFSNKDLFLNILIAYYCNNKNTFNFSDFSQCASSYVNKNDYKMTKQKNRYIT